MAALGVKVPYQRYPKMLYRPAFTKGRMVWGARVDNKIVENRKEDVKSRFVFWMPATPAVRTSKILHFIVNVISRHSGKIIGAILALLVGIILFHYEENHRNKQQEPSPQVLTHVVQT